MKLSSYIMGAGLTLLASAGAGGPPVAAAPFAFIDPKTRTTLVEGEDEIVREGATAVRTTVYRDAARAVIGRETCRYDAQTLALSSLVFEDLGVGEKYEVAVKDGKASVSYRDGAGKEPQTSVIDWDDKSYLPRLLVDLIAVKWAELRRKGEVSFDMYVPFLLRTVGFRIRAGRGDKGVSVVTVVPTVFLLRPFVPSIEFTFADQAEPKFLGYRGPAAVAIDGERHRQIEMAF